MQILYPAISNGLLADEHIIAEIENRLPDRTMLHFTEDTETNVTEYSNKKVWWICKKHHSWQAVIGYRARGFGCPVCASRKLLPGFNDLATKRPDLAEAWDYEKNDGLTPQMIMPASNRKVWWRCKKGHSYQATPANRIYCIECCYYCNGRRVLAGFNDIATTHPEVLKIWDYDRNQEVSPKSLSAGRATKVWWKCEVGHSWEAAINSRVRNIVACPICNGRKLQSGDNDIATTHPEVLQLWDYEKNTGVDPTTLSAMSVLKVWWKCENGHSWMGLVRANTKGKCPYCAGRYKGKTRFIT